MGKQCSCIASVPAEHEPKFNSQLMKIDVSYTQKMRIDTGRNEKQRAELLVGGYVRLNDLISTPFDVNILLLCRQYYFNEEPLLRKRCIFLSLLHLNKCIRDIPKTVLKESIFCFKANKSELLPKLNIITADDSDLMLQNGYSTPSELEAAFNPCVTLSSSTALDPLTIKYCVDKMSNGLLILLEDDKSWKDVSKDLGKIKDTFYGNKRDYSSLKLDDEYWMNEYAVSSPSRYMVKADEVIREIDETNLKFYPAMELIAQSNPTLIPFTKFDLNEYEMQNGVHGQTWINNKSIQSPVISEWSMENDDMVFCCDTSSDSDHDDQFENSIQY